MSKDQAAESFSSATTPRRSAKSQKQRVAGLVALVVVAGAGLFYFGTEWYKGWKAERTVTSYLEAVQDGKVEEALSYTGSGNIRDTIRTDFLTSDALNTAWDVLEVSAQGKDTSSSTTDYIWVDATIGLEGGTQVSNTFRVAHDSDRGWRVGSAFAYLAFDSANYGYLEINGHTASETIDEARTVPQVFALLPGIYDFYSEAQPLLEFEGDAVLLMGSENQMAGGQPLSEAAWEDLDISDRLHLSDDADERYHQAIQNHVDDCVEALTGDDHEGTHFPCELGATEQQLTSEVGESYSDFRNYQWEVSSYPTAVLEYFPEPSGELIWLRGESKQSGKATLMVEASEADGGVAQFHFSCEVSIDHSRAVVDHTGGIYFHPKRFLGLSGYRNIYETTWDDFFADTNPCSLDE